MVTAFCTWRATCTPSRSSTSAPSARATPRAWCRCLRWSGRGKNPRFFHGPKRELLFTYRDGGSGNGDQLYNVYESRTRTWKRLLETPLTDGEGERNAYPGLPTLGPDGRFHTLKGSDIIDPIAQKGGAVNGLVKPGFDARKRPVISYTKYDVRGNSQIYCARREGDGWRVVQISDRGWR